MFVVLAVEAVFFQAKRVPIYTTIHSKSVFWGLLFFLPYISSIIKTVKDIFLQKYFEYFLVLWSHFVLRLQMSKWGKSFLK